jgi:nitroimidazol reductase NimA-like FMN-containing flavoprotein (pyridoxamine 5'-phosphate oxidase superfamily)
MRASAPAFAPPGSLLDWDWVLELLAAARSAWLATVRPDGRPHASPLWVVVVDRRIWFSTSATTAKARNLAWRGHLGSAQIDATRFSRVG